MLPLISNKATLISMYREFVSFTPDQEIENPLGIPKTNGFSSLISSIPK
jgi:hypothetical protein